MRRTWLAKTGAPSCIRRFAQDERGDRCRRRLTTACAALGLPIPWHRVALGSLRKTNAAIGAVEVDRCMRRTGLTKALAPKCSREQGRRVAIGSLRKTNGAIGAVEVDHCKRRGAIGSWGRAGAAIAAAEVDLCMRRTELTMTRAPSCNRHVGQDERSDRRSGG
eukprot:6553241-Pyramimonas_sp.AAC.1